MRNKFTLLLILVSIINFAQTTEFKVKNVKVSFDKNIDSNKVFIRFSQGTWNVTLFPLFENNQILENTFPVEAGIYNLAINYSNELHYNEITLYKSSPKSEEISFYFYEDCGRIFCRIQSEYAQELNKEIVLNKFDEEMQKIINAIKE
jgi:hypothetical protein